MTGSPARTSQAGADPTHLPEAGLAAARGGASIDQLAALAQGCQGCDLFARATQTVFGEGAAGARVMLVGEQPGDSEDRSGHPFVGPAGKILDRALAEAGIDRERTFVTNVVKHFKWRRSGKRRLHERPNAVEVAACRPWFEAELAAVHPQAIVCLGATAARALLGASVRVTETAGRPIPSDLAPMVVATLHPSAILRADDADRDAMYERLVGDLRMVA
jgi:uracil-DNA glycosylase family protein